jgi:hypothetical protein
MSWVDESDHAFAGILEKLKRAHENIVNLNTEIGAFFEASNYPIFSDTDSEQWQDAVNYHRDLVIPKRFSVLSGEIAHHLRSCLDYVVWHFSDAGYRTIAENAVEFPVCRKEPLTKDEIGRYERKVKGITNPNVLSLIRDMQPYKRGGDPENDPVCIVHDMDRFDKHRELTIVAACAGVIVPTSAGIEAARAVTKYGQGETLTGVELGLAHETIKQNAKVSPQVAFAEFGKRKDQFVVPALAQLHEAIFKRIDLFADLG